ncbi:MAG: leucine-rich repeat domain-containing protein [Candidatus Hermodarchaeota archaeon]
MKTLWYQGVNLYASEVEVLSLLEEQIGEPILQVPVIGWTNVGFTAQHNRVTGLGLNNIQLASLPESIDQLVNLTILNLEENQLATMPASVGRLVNLEYLYLGGNRLSSLPETINQLMNLKRLNLSENEFSFLPEPISHLVNLQGLYLDRNQLAVLPETISQLVNLKDLYLEENQLAALPKGISCLVKLEYLKLGNNLLVSLPEGIGQLSRLRSLDLTDNLFHTASLADQLRLLWLSHTIKHLTEYVPTALFAHPLVQGLKPESLKQFDNQFCVYCGASEVVSGVIKDTGQERVFCTACENVIS